MMVLEIRIVDNGSCVTVVGVDRNIAVYRNNGGNGFAQILGLFRAGLAAYIDSVGVKTDISVTEVVNSVGGNDGTVKFAAVDVADLLEFGFGAGGVGNIGVAGGKRGDFIVVAHFLDWMVAILRAALEVMHVVRSKRLSLCFKNL